VAGVPWRVRSTAGGGTRLTVARFAERVAAVGRSGEWPHKQILAEAARSGVLLHPRSGGIHHEDS
jgi:hypothetical protein